MPEVPYDGSELVAEAPIAYLGEYPDLPEFQHPWQYPQVPSGEGKMSDEGGPLLSAAFTLCRPIILFSRDSAKTCLLHIWGDVLSDTQIRLLDVLGASGETFDAVKIRGDRGLPDQIIESRAFRDRVSIGSAQVIPLATGTRRRFDVLVKDRTIYCDIRGIKQMYSFMFKK